jgi:hypothetical protein
VISGEEAKLYEEENTMTADEALLYLYNWCLKHNYNPSFHYYGVNVPSNMLTIYTQLGPQYNWCPAWGNNDLSHCKYPEDLGKIIDALKLIVRPYRSRKLYFPLC